ncbi:oligopeptide ABC transporter ATP-binding protein [Candidatus Heimdallarchaeota archaeon B3_Heim]|nr:MAG: oligopeptide ABC transporter ATP-binding protein [Candidatus Heimdallarchaeota archaeon B3_Heim]
MSSTTKILFTIKDLRKWFPTRTGLLDGIRRRQEYVRAVDDISFEIKQGEVVCLVGESGSGKTTAARLLLRLEDPTGGEIIYKGKDIAKVKERQIRKLRRHMQMIFQNPYESLDPRMTIYDVISEPLQVTNVFPKSETHKRVAKALEDVGLIPVSEFSIRFPHELSGGQRQRVSIARALVLDPEFIIADEPASMLDANTRIEILNLLQDLQAAYNMGILFITHDLAQARYLGHRIIILYLGKIVEKGNIDQVIQNPHHPYSKALISNIPVPDPDAKRERIEIEGEIPTAINLPPGCRFAPRCPFQFEKCIDEEPELMMKDGRYSACWLD